MSEIDALFSRPDVEASSLKDAATAVLVRPGNPFDVFLVKRAFRSGFMGGMYVFPGGKLDEADFTSAMQERLSVEALEECQANIEETAGCRVDAEFGLAWYVASIRELFEEAGILLARCDDQSDYVRFDDSETRERFTKWRSKLIAGDVKFLQILQEENLTLAVNNLVYFAHWLTPSRERRRYDTRFFLTHLPNGQEPIIDEKETVDGVWRSPAAAIADYRMGELALAPPTLRILEDLSAHETLDALMRWARAREVWPIMPRIGVVDEQIAILLPWDPHFPDTEGEMVQGLPEPHPMAGGPSRVVFEDEQWFSRGP